MNSLQERLWLPPSRLSSSLLLSSFCCSMSFFFNLKKTLSVKSTCLFFSSFVIHWRVQFPSSFPHVSTSPAVTRFFFLSYVGCVLLQACSRVPCMALEQNLCDVWSEAICWPGECFVCMYRGGSSLAVVTNPVTELFYGQYRAEGEHEGQ